jgi:hypothetical protein
MSKPDHNFVKHGYYFECRYGMESGTMYLQLWGYPAPERAGIGVVKSAGEFGSRIQELKNLFEKLRTRVRNEYRVEQIHENKVGAPFTDRIVSVTIWRHDGQPIACEEIENLL